MDMKRRTFGLQVATAAVAMVLSAAAYADEVTWWVTEPGKTKAQALAAAFEKENPGTTIKLQANPYGGLEGKVLIALKSGSPPDVIEVQSSWIPSYQATGALSDIGEVIAGSVPLSDFVPATLQA